MTEHIEVASYVLGLMDPDEMSRFENHLAECDECGQQLDAMMPVVNMLADVEPGDLFDIEGPSALSTLPSSTPIQEAAPPPAPPTAPYRPVELRSAGNPREAPQYPREVPDYPQETPAPIRFPREAPTPAPDYPDYPAETPAAARFPQETPPTGNLPVDRFRNQGPTTGSIPVDRYPGQGPATGGIPIDRHQNPATGGIPIDRHRNPATGGVPLDRYSSERYPAGGPPTGESRTIEPLGQRGSQSRKIPLSRPQQPPPPQAQPQPRYQPSDGPDPYGRRDASDPYGRRRSSLMLASAAAIIGIVAGAGGVVAGPWFKSDTSTGTSITSASGKLSATDAKTGVHADVVLQSKPWGTLVSFGVRDIDGPRKCRLLAVKTDGQSEVLSTWTVPKQGYGTKTEPQELALMAATSLRSKDIAALRVQDVGEADEPDTLVTVKT